MPPALGPGAAARAELDGHVAMAVAAVAAVVGTHMTCWRGSHLITATASVNSD